MQTEKLATLLLKSQHVYIGQCLDLFKTFTASALKKHECDKSIWKMFFDFFEHYIGDIHHSIEEQILFPYLKILVPFPGGPKCSYYSDLSRLDGSIEDKAQQIKLDMSWDKLTLPSFDGNPFKPILEDHFLGHTYLKIMKELVAAGNSDQANLLHYYATKYTSMLLTHIEKEDSCLAPILDELLSLEQQNEAIVKARDLEIFHREKTKGLELINVEDWLMNLRHTLRGNLSFANFK